MSSLLPCQTSDTSGGPILIAQPHVGFVKVFYSPTSKNKIAVSLELTFGSRDLNDQTSINPNEIAKGMVLEERTGNDDEDGFGGGKDNDDDDDDDDSRSR